jgi:hypothetical protein
MSIIDRTLESYSESIEDRLYYLSNPTLRAAALKDIEIYATGILKLIEFEFDHKKTQITINLDLIE